MKNIRIFLSTNFHFLVVNFSIYLNRRNEDDIYNFQRSTSILFAFSYEISTTTK